MDVRREDEKEQKENGFEKKLDKMNGKHRVNKMKNIMDECYN